MTLSPSAYRTAFDDHPDGVVVLDPEAGEVSACNERFAELVDRDADALAGREIAAVIDGSGGTLDEAVNGQDDGRLWLRVDGGSIPVDVRASTTEIDGDERLLVRVIEAAAEEADADASALSPERKARAMDEAPIGITISDPEREDNPLIYANEGFERITGYSSSETVGRNCRFLQGEATDPETVAEIRAGIDAAEPVSAELRNYRKDGTEFWNRVTIAPVRDDDGAVTNFVGFQVDVTERKRYERELKLADHLLETVPVGLLRTSPASDAGFEYANPALASLLGAESVEQLREHDVADFYADPAERSALLDDLDSEGAVQRETAVETLDGERRDVLITARLTEDEMGGKQIHKAVQDITTRKEYERRLREQRDNLDVLNQILRHDVRNDLQLVTAYADLLADHVDEEGAEYLETIRASADSAVELTRTARDMADVMLSTEANRQPVALGETLEAEIEDARSDYPAAEIVVEGRIPEVTVLANEMLDSVFRNLLTNAIQHNDTERPTVRISAERTDGMVTVRVADDGPGIPDAQKEEVFGKGEKGLESEGTGVGLYLVETLVEMYGGDVRVEDNDPRGAVFVVDLPVAE